MAANTRELLVGHGLAPSKKRGQNFLKHRSTALQIVAKAGFSKDDHIVEVGVGLGALTLCLAQQVSQVTGIEIDRGIVAYLEESAVLPENVSLIHEDILKCDFTALSSQVAAPLKIISNLPYSISNPFIFKLLDNRALVDRAVVLLQKEMAQRITSVPHCKEYGIPSVLVQGCAQVRQLMQVGAAEFHPRPKVDSLLVEIQFDPEKSAVDHFDTLRDTVRAAFSSRRKTLANNLRASLPADILGSMDKDQKRSLILEILEATNLRPDIRAEDVTVEEFKILAERISKLS
ncbi:MAG: ribosomal RNA small subunit methyltransferase A [Desulfofustis sp.]|nr:ribosomal RNA small subunit methyltransferase A [Desulfofustis sp.]